MPQLPKIRFSSRELLLLMIPLAFLANWLSVSWRRGEIQWQKFSLESLKTARLNKRPALILCRPEIWSVLDQNQLAGQLPSCISNTEIDIYLCDYQYWSKQRTPLDQWVIDRGAGKDPRLILIAKDGKTKTAEFYELDAKTTISFLELNNWQTIRERVALGLFLLTSVVVGCILTFRRRPSNYLPNASNNQTTP